MADPLDWSSQVVLGQYIPTESVIHRMDPRAKLISFTVFLGVLTFTHTILLEVTWLLVLLALLPAGHISIRYFLRGLRPTVPLLVLFMFLQLFFLPVPARSSWWIHWGFIHIGEANVSLIFSGVLRFIDIFLLIQLLTASTPLTDLAHAFEQMLAPLSKIHFPAHEIALIFVITLRFVPTFAKEADKIRRAQASRGADVGTAHWWQWIKRTKSVFPILLPLFILAVNRAEDLVIAMEARGFVPGYKRTRYVEFLWNKSDTYMLFTVVLFSLMMGWWQVIK